MSLIQHYLPDVFVAELYVRMAETLGVSAAMLDEDDPRKVVVDTEHEQFSKLETDFGQRLGTFGLIAQAIIEKMHAQYREEHEEKAESPMDHSFKNN